MSNKRAFVLGIATVFGIYVAMSVVAEIVENRVIRYLKNDNFVVGGVIVKNINGNKNAKQNEKEGS